MNLEFRGRIFATPSALTMVVNGVEIHSGQVGVGQPLDTEFTLVNIPNVSPDTSLSVTVSTTSGVVTAGWVRQLAGDPGSDPVSPDLRDSPTILLNGMPPEWPATPVEPMPGGTAENPDWSGWFFEVSAGETITFNVVVPAEAPPVE